MRAYHEIGPLGRVMVRKWPVGTPTVEMYVTQGPDRVYYRDVTLEVKEILELAHQIGREQRFKYLYALQSAMDRPSPRERIVGKVSTGVVLSVLGIGFGSLALLDIDFLAMAVVSLSAGLGFLAAAWISHALTQRWGLLGAAPSTTTD